MSGRLSQEVEIVKKSRLISEYSTIQWNGVDNGSIDAKVGSEVMEDSSVSGSARTEVDAVDRFLADPSNRHDFHRALRESNKTAGDAGLADFRVTRSIRSRTIIDSLRIVGNTGNVTTVNNFATQHSLVSGFPALTPFVAPNSAQLRANGQRLYHQALPMKNQADLGVMIGEIASNPVRGLTIPGSALKKAVEVQGTSIKRLNRQARTRHRQIRGLPLEEARVAADDYLAYIFGLRPNVQTLDDLAASINSSRHLAEMVVRDGSRRLRRRRSLPEKRAINSSVSTGGVISPGGFSTNWVVSDMTTHYFAEATQRTWFSGAFRMPVSDAETWLERSSDFFHRIDYLSGIGFDVRTAWDLVPFSFIADWFANTGDFLENRQVIADYNIVTEYGYVMCHTTHTRSFAYDGILRHNSGDQAAKNFYGQVPVRGSGENLVETKLRARCDSFGFYTDWNNLTAFQWSALTALGLSFSAGVRPRVRT